MNKTCRNASTLISAFLLIFVFFVCEFADHQHVSDEVMKTASFCCSDDTEELLRDSKTFLCLMSLLQKLWIWLFLWLKQVRCQIDTYFINLLIPEGNSRFWFISEIFYNSKNPQLVTLFKAACWLVEFVWFYFAWQSQHGKTNMNYYSRKRCAVTRVLCK